jgi:hypothetical protein
MAKKKTGIGVKMGVVGVMLCVIDDATSACQQLHVLPEPSVVVVLDGCRQAGRQP